MGFLPICHPHSFQYKHKQTCCIDKLFNWYSHCSEQPRAMDVYEIALIYADSAHQGDRRKKSQQCAYVPTLTCIELAYHVVIVQTILGWPGVLSIIYQIFPI